MSGLDCAKSYCTRNAFLACLGYISTLHFQAVLRTFGPCSEASNNRENALRSVEEARQHLEGVETEVCIVQRFALDMEISLFMQVWGVCTSGGVDFEDVEGRDYSGHRHEWNICLSFYRLRTCACLSNCIAKVHIIPNYTLEARMGGYRHLRW